MKDYPFKYILLCLDGSLEYLLVYGERKYEYDSSDIQVWISGRGCASINNSAEGQIYNHVKDLNFELHIASMVVFKSKFFSYETFHSNAVVPRFSNIILLKESNRVLPYETQ